MRSKYIIASLALACCSFSLTGCLPMMRSMGASIMPTPLDHRISGNDDSSHVSVSASGFWGHSYASDNIQNMNAGGANISTTYRMGGDLSFLFMNVAVGGIAGSTRFACNTDECKDKYSEDYKDWLKTSDGYKKYTFWDMQERILAGADFNPGTNVFLGFGVGMQLYQGSSSYDQTRKDLSDIGFVENLDGNTGYGILTAFWLGTRLDPEGKYGNLSSEMDIFIERQGEALSDVKLTYTHSSGFFGGVSMGSIIGFALYAGKTFTF